MAMLVITRGYDMLRSRFYCAPMVCSSVAALDHFGAPLVQVLSMTQGKKIEYWKSHSSLFQHVPWSLRSVRSVGSVGDFKHGIPWWMHTSIPWGPFQWGMNMQVPAVLAWYAQEVFWTSILDACPYCQDVFFFPDGFRIDSHWLTISSTPLIGNWRYIYIYDM
jgi:hypothetical protein